MLTFTRCWTWKPVNVHLLSTPPRIKGAAARRNPFCRRESRESICGHRPRAGDKNYTTIIAVRSKRALVDILRTNESRDPLPFPQPACRAIILVGFAKYTKPIMGTLKTPARRHSCPRPTGRVTRSDGLIGEQVSTPPVRFEPGTSL